VPLYQINLAKATSAYEVHDLKVIRPDFSLLLAHEIFHTVILVAGNSGCACGDCFSEHLFDMLFLDILDNDALLMGCLSFGGILL